MLIIQEAWTLNMDIQNLRRTIHKVSYSTSIMNHTTSALESSALADALDSSSMVKPPASSTHGK
jgi:hypothetical protein